MWSMDRPTTGQQQYPTSFLKMQGPRLHPSHVIRLWRLLIPEGSQLWPQLPQTLEQTLQEECYRCSPKQPGMETREERRMAEWGGMWEGTAILCMLTITESSWH